MENIENKTNIRKYNFNTYNVNKNETISSKYYNTNSLKHRNYFASSEEKTNSKSNHQISDINQTTSSKYKFNSKLASNNDYYKFSNSQILFNDNDNTRTESAKYNKYSNQDNSSQFSNHALISLNSFLHEKNSNSTIPNHKNYRNSMDLNNSRNSFQKYMKHNSHNLIKFKANNCIQEDSYNKYNDKNYYQKNEKYGSIEYDTKKNYEGRKIYSINEQNKSNLNKNSYQLKKNINDIKIVDYRNESNILNSKKNIKYNLYENNKKGNKDNQLSLNIKRNNINIIKNNTTLNIQSNQNINQKKIITVIPNNKKKFETIEIKTNNLRKRPDINKIKKKSLINISNLSHNNESPKKNFSKKTHHSFFEIKSLTKELPQQKNMIAPKQKKKTIGINNNNSGLNISINKKSESNLRQSNYNNINRNNNLENKNNLIKLDNKGENENIRDRKINLSDLNKCLINEGKLYLLTKQNIINNEIKNKNNNYNINLYINVNNNFKKYDKTYLNKDKIKIDYKLKTNEENNISKSNYNNKEKNYKMIDIINKGIISKRMESFKRFNKYKRNEINSYFFTYFPIYDKGKTNNIKNNNKQKKNIILKNLNNKTFEEDFIVKLKNNKYRYKRINKYLKPEVSVRITLFSITQPEKERYFYVNYFYSQNIRNQFIKEENEFYF